MNLTCQRCKHEWEYNGKRSYFVTCPNCRTSVSITKATVYL
jgi:Zn finger protein HypA/HybF involved in hydrogenase expression